MARALTIKIIRMKIIMKKGGKMTPLHSKKDEENSYLVINVSKLIFGVAICP